MNKEIYKQGDKIQWTFENNHQCKHLSGKTFSANIAIVNQWEEVYGVYAEYGMDLIPFKNAILIQENNKINENKNN